MENFDFNSKTESNLDALEKKFKYYMKDLPLTQEELQKPLLDVGTGGGNFIKYLREVLGNKTAIGVDYSANRIGPAYEGLMIADGFSLPFDDETFDTVVAHNYLPMFVDYPAKMQASIMELIRVTKKGGRMMGDIATEEASIEFDETLKKHLGEEYTQSYAERHEEKIRGIRSFATFLEELDKEDSFEVNLIKDQDKTVLIILKNN